MQKLLFLIMNISTVLLSFALNQERINKALYDVAAIGDIVTAKALLQAGASLNSKDRIFQQKPLHMACGMHVMFGNGHADMVKLFLENGALVDETNRDHGMPLHWAAHRGNVSIANVLLEHGANVNSKDSSSQQTPLYWACEQNHADIVKLLLEKGALVDETDQNGETPLHWAAGGGNISIANVLLEHGAANVNSKDRKSQRTPLHVACDKNHTGMVKLLLENGASVDEIDQTGQTPLHFAVKNDDFTIANLLLERGAKVNSKDSVSELTPLQLACQKNHADIVKLLLEKGALDDKTDIDKQMCFLSVVQK